MVSDLFWKEEISSDGVTLYTAVPDCSTAVLVKRFMTVPCTPEELVKAIESRKFQTKHHSHIKNVNILSQLPQGHKVIHRVLGAMLLLKSRDFCYCSGIYDKGDGGYLISHKDMQDCYKISEPTLERGIYEGYCDISPVGKSQTKILSVTKLDLNGKVPLTIMKKLPQKLLDEYVTIKHVLSG